MSFLISFPAFSLICITSQSYQPGPVKTGKLSTMIFHQNGVMKKDIPCINGFWKKKPWLMMLLTTLNLVWQAGNHFAGF
jgi:hypothetical protein